MIPVVKENESLKHALKISAGAPVKVVLLLVKEIIDTPPPVTNKKKYCQNNQRQQCGYFVFYSNVLFHKFLHKNSLQFC